MIDQSTKAFFLISNFTSLEDQLKLCLDFLPYTEETKKVVSPRFIPIILDSCALIESILKDLIDTQTERNNFKRYASKSEKYLDLESAYSIFLNSSIEFINPFLGWTIKTPSWWTAYNRLKHDRLNSYSVATYETTIHAVCALHQVISRNRLLIPNLITAGWFNYDDSQFVELLSAQHVGIGVTPIGVMAVESKCFVSPLQSNFVEFKNDVPTITGDCEFSPRVTAMVWSYEWGF